MNSDLFMAWAIGLLVFAALYLGLNLVFPDGDTGTRRTKALFAAAGYLLVTLYLWQNRDALYQVASRLTWELVAVVIAVLLVMRAALRRR